MNKCPKCGNPVNSHAVRCDECYTKLFPKMDDQFFILTSTNNIDGYEIIVYKDIVYGEIVCPNGILGALTNGTFFTVSALTDARRKAIDELKRSAKAIGANAIVGMDIDISDLNGNGILVSANGTAVYVVHENIEEHMQQREIEEKEKREKAEEEKKKEKEEQEKRAEILKSGGDIDYTGLLEKLGDLKNAREIRDYLVSEGQATGDSKLLTVAETMVKTVEIERLYGNMKKSALDSIKQYF